jgi:hypothetical protein
VSERPVPLHRETHPDLDVEGCLGCKLVGLRFNLTRLRAENQGHYTQASIARDIFANARDKKIDIQQVRGRRRPHLKKTESTDWQKV